MEYLINGDRRSAQVRRSTIFEKCDTATISSVFQKRLPREMKKKGKCTACGLPDELLKHPILPLVKICKHCFDRIVEDDDWFAGGGAKDEDGYDEYCRWCADAGHLMLCSTCTRAFCEECIQGNFGEEEANRIKKADYWKCFVCNPKPLRELYIAKKDQSKKTEGDKIKPIQQEIKVMKKDKEKSLDLEDLSDLEEEKSNEVDEEQADEVAENAELRKTRYQKRV
jgi:hypothetical protein